MLQDILFVAFLFATRVVIPLVAMLVLGEFIARRADRPGTSES